jgi:polysaccharide biosynthesis/export protein
MKILKTTLIFVSLSMLTSCVSKKKMVYLQNVTASTPIVTSYEPLIQKDDILYINVSSVSEEAVAPFNLDTKAVTGNSTMERQTYLVDFGGNIDFPVIGTIKVGNTTVNDLKLQLRKKLSEYVSDVVVNIRIMNFKVSVLGEVNKPGVINVNSQRITLLDALAIAGDLTLYGRRNNILIMRENKGVKTTARIDLTNPDFMNSEFYYLDQNDVVYVEPNKRKLDSTAIGTNITSLISILGFVITTTILLTKK